MCIYSFLIIVVFIDSALSSEIDSVPFQILMTVENSFSIFLLVLKQ